MTGGRRGAEPRVPAARQLHARVQADRRRLKALQRRIAAGRSDSAAVQAAGHRRSPASPDGTGPAARRGTVLTDLARGRARRSDVDRIQRHAPEGSGRGACRHPDGAIRLMASALRTFAEDVSAHAAGFPCPESRRAPALTVPEGS